MMGKQAINKFYLFIIVFLFIFKGVSSAETTVDDLTGEDKENFDKFRKVFTTGTPDEFYKYAEFYEKYLKKRGHMMLYYKLKNNEGFFALRHNLMFRAMEYAKQLDQEVRKNEAKDYFYLPTGLMGDVYYASHNTLKAERYFTQALSEVGDRDPKFTMRTYNSLAEMLMLKSPQRSLEWIERAIEMARNQDNIEYTGLSIGMKAYISFILGDEPLFQTSYDQYVSLRSMDSPLFNHRYDRVLEVAKLAFDGDYQKAFQQIRLGNLSVDSSLVATRVFVMEGDIGKTFEAVKRHYVEMDSIFSQSLDTNFDQLATESTIMRSKEEAQANQRMAKKLTNWLIGLTIVYIIVYIMGRRRLIRKIWARNAELKETAKRAEESDKMKTVFIQNMSHEIRTPLNAVAGFSQLLCDHDYELSEKEKQNMKQRISDNVESVISIVYELLELSKSESESTVTEEQKSDVVLNKLCRSTIRSMAGKKEKVEMRFASNVKDDFTIHTDGHRIARILTHLLSNALKFTDEGYVEVRCNLLKSEKTLTISVTDTGVGIAEKDRERIFETFAKLDDFKEGIGLGLPICRRLASSIGAKIELDTAYTDGTRFIFSMPCEK